MRHYDNKLHELVADLRNALATTGALFLWVGMLFVLAQTMQWWFYN